MASIISKLSVTQLERAITIRQQIERLEAELDALASGSEAPIRRGPGRPSLRAQLGVLSAPVAKKKRKMSPEARARIAAAQKARWAKAKSGK